MKEEKAKVTATVKPVASSVAKPIIKATEPVKTEVPAVKAEAAVKTEKVVAKAAPVKKAPAKTAKPAAKKAPAKKAAVKKAVSIKENVCLEFAEKSYSTEDLLKITKDIWKFDLKKKVADIASVDLYVKPEESKVYYVVNGTVTGDFEI